MEGKQIYTKKLFELNKKQKEIIDSPDVNIVAKDKDLFQYCILINFTKAYKTHQAIMLLCEKGFGEDGLILARTILEIVITLRFILEEETLKQQRVQRYFEFDLLQRYEMYKTLVTNPKDLQRLVLDRKVQANDIPVDLIKQKAEEFLEKYKDEKGNPPNTQNWSGLSIKKMAYKLGMKKTYDTAYELGSKQTHSSSLSIGRLLSIENENKIKLHTEPSLTECDTSLIVGFEHFYYILEIVNNAFNLNIKSELDSLVKEFNEVMKNS